MELCRKVSRLLSDIPPQSQTDTIPTLDDAVYLLQRREVEAPARAGHIDQPPGARVHQRRQDALRRLEERGPRPRASLVAQVADLTKRDVLNANTNTTRQTISVSQYPPFLR